MPDAGFIEVLENCIRNRDCQGVVRLFFEDSPPRLRSGFYREDAYWDFKAGCPSLRDENELAWAEIAALVLALHNAEGGVIFFGIDDARYSFCGTLTPIDAKRFNDKIRRYVGDTFWVAFNREFVQPNGLYLGVAIVPRHGLTLKRFQAAASPRQGSVYFEAGDLPVRLGDETRIFRGDDALSFLREKKSPIPDSRFFVDEPGYRIIRPDYDDFITRSRYCEAALAGLTDRRSYTTSLTGIGGAGKTALACWAVLEAYKGRMFDYIVSVSAKDRELSPAGIEPIVPSLTSFATLLDEILDVTGCSEFKSLPDKDKEDSVRALIRGENCLLFVDNLETVDDVRILQFLETLPEPVKAITTSRRVRVRHSIYPIDVGVFEAREAVRLLHSQAERRGRDFLLDLPESRKLEVVEACSFLPLVIEWFVGRVRNGGEVYALEEALRGSGRTGEELLEFCFRRVHDQLSPAARRVLKVLSIFDKPEPIEPIAGGVQLPIQATDDALEELRECALVEAAHEPRVSAVTYSVLPLTRKFANAELLREGYEEAEIRKRLNRYFQAADIAEPAQRQTISEMRLGVRDPGTELVNVAIALARSGKRDEAEHYFKDAIRRNPRDWRAYREMAEFYRHAPVPNIGEALRLYEQAHAWAPKKGPDRALLLREYGILLRDSGLPGAMKRAADLLEEALGEYRGRDDSVCRHALGDALMRLSMHRRAVEVLVPLLDHANDTPRQKTYPLLEQLYSRLNERIALDDLRKRMAKDVPRR
jgi:tetratricopeptide (TPR) repeat protein